MRRQEASKELPNNAQMDYHRSEGSIELQHVAHRTSMKDIFPKADYDISRHGACWVKSHITTLNCKCAQATHKKERIALSIWN